jgi:hypothetical protein
MTYRTRLASLMLSELCRVQLFLSLQQTARMNAKWHDLAVKVPVILALPQWQRGVNSRLATRGKEVIARSSQRVLTFLIGCCRWWWSIAMRVNRPKQILTQKIKRHRRNYR